MQTDIQPLLAAEAVTFAYGSDPVLKDVDLGVFPGEIVALVGPNGCGKSTLLKTLARVLKPDTGRVLLEGAPIQSMASRDVARRLSLLPQGPIAPEGLTVEELVAQGRFPHQTLLRQWSPGDREAVERAIDVTDLADLADRPVATLSGGQRQRCWIAMTLAQDTPLMLLDEPTTFLDLKVQIDVMALLTKIAQEGGRTLLIVLHEINLAAAFADRIVMMQKGRIVGDGKAEDVITPDLLRAVFDLHADVITDPETGRPVCLPRIPKSAAQSDAARAAE